jgi:hypothetical protein
MLAQPATSLLTDRVGQRSGQAELSLAWLESLAAAAMIVSACFLHGLFLRTAGPLWRDEVNLINLAHSHSAGTLLNDSFPILMPLLMKLWLVPGHSDLWLRSLGSLCGLVLPAVFWLTGRSTGKIPLLSLTLVCLNEYFIRYGDSLRAYGLGTALICASLAATLWLLKQPSWSRAGLLAVTAILSVQTLYQNALLFLAIALGGFAVCWRKKDAAAGIKILVPGLLAALSLVPYLPHLQNLSAGSVELRAQFSPALAWTAFAEASGFPVSQLTGLWLVLIIAVVVSALMQFGRHPWSSFWRSQDPMQNPVSKTMLGLSNSALLLFAAVTISTVLILFVCFLWFAAVPVRPWYWVPPLALIAICFDLATPWAHLPRLPRLIALALTFGIALLSATASAQRLRVPFTNVERITRQLNASMSPGDFVLVTPWYLGISFQHYSSQNAGISWQTLPPLSDHLTHRYDLVLAQMQNPNAVQKVFETASETLRAGHRVWVAGSMSIPGPRTPVPAPLPPPPLPRSGYSDWPYANSWSAQTACHLARHSTRFEQVSPPGSGAEAVDEHFDLFVVEGWRE